MNKVIVSSYHPAELLTNVVSVSDEGDNSKNVVLQVTKTLQRSFVIPSSRILRHVASPDNKGTLLLANHHVTLEFKDATVEQVSNGFTVHTGDDKEYFFNGGFSSYVVEGKQSTPKADDEDEDDPDECPAGLIHARPFVVPLGSA